MRALAGPATESERAYESSYPLSFLEGHSYDPPLEGVQELKTEYGRPL